MNDQEFKQFTQRLFVQYPSLCGWLKNNSPDPAGTLKHWQRVLASCTLEECLNVLDGWEQTTEDPFGFNTRDKAANLIRSVLENRRDKERAKARQRKIAEEYKQKRGHPTTVNGPLPIGRHFDSAMWEAVEECKPLHQRHLTGELTRYEYETQRDEIIEKHLGKSEKPEMQEWAP